MRSSELVDGDVLSIGRYQIRMRCRYRGQGFAVGASDPAREAAGGGARVADRPRVRASGLPAPRSGRRCDRVPGGIRHSARSGLLLLPSLVSHLEAVASGAALPGRMSQPEVCESALVPLVNQFSMMQQQMFDQFQQAMGMLVQMFGTMHREQMEVIREELDRLHQLSKELQELKDELAKPSRQPVTPSGELAAGGLPGQSRPRLLIRRRWPHRDFERPPHREFGLPSHPRLAVRPPSRPRRWLRVPTNPGPSPPPRARPEPRHPPIQTAMPSPGSISGS